MKWKNIDPNWQTALGAGCATFIIVLAAFLTWQHYSVNDKPPAPQPTVLGETAPTIATRQPEPVKPVAPELRTALNLGNIRAKSFLAYDAASGALLAERNSRFPLPMASLTKLMTGYAVYKNANLGETVTITRADSVNISPTLGLKNGDQILVQDLFSAMLIGSANDAAQALANYMARKSGTSFVALMNQAAQELGMADTHYSNAMGFDSETNYSTAADLRLLVEATRKYQAFALVGRSSFYRFTSESGNVYNIKATNKLLAGDPEITAIKTGYTNEAQGAMITEITHNGHTFIIVVMGSPDREGDTLKLKQTIIASYVWN